MQTRAKASTRKFQMIAGAGIFAAFIALGALLQVSSQGDSSDTYPKGFRGNTCTVETETLTIGYSSYYLSDEYEISEDEPRTPYIPVQCGKIPQPGMLNISIDLLHPDSSRNVPLAMRLAKLVYVADETVEEREILSVPARPHPSGVITHAFRLDEIGHYVIYLDGTSPENIHYLVRVPVIVGHDWRDNLRNFLPPFLRKYI
ncbi:hypothetical protein SAMN05216326_10177 [Nitrosomonas marina]|uniref:Uncharacterized protein n=1 Tax=Nitrosomonas marina TaxID=917 RepID=A0A1H9Y5A7_9PROT|nr:hypothetical protein [Nitrosomonas marina]SES63885.1 hypothetical protein SAMN05216326_10177 [Nitrosomonas marina]